MISIIDVSGTNLASLSNALSNAGFAYQLTHDEEEIRKASHVILPGVGSARFGMEALIKANLIPVLSTLTQPVLGICLGMQLLFEYNEEGALEGLGLIPGRVEKIQAPSYPVPHMGWNQLQWRQHSVLQQGIKDSDYVYFVHSYAVKPGPFCLAQCTYGEPLSAIVQKDNLFGMQFHPEKSGEVGMTLLNNFCKL